MRIPAPIPRREFLLLAGLALPQLGAAAPAAEPQTIEAPNVVPISARLVSSGQPSAAALGRLASQGFGAVIYLAPPTVADAVRDEAAIVEGQGLVYVNIPIVFDRPSEADFDAFVAAMRRLSALKLLVHCQVNMRASSLVFLHRVVVGKEAPEQAYEAVAKVWSPRGPWRELIVAVLRKHQIGFEPY